MFTAIVRILRTIRPVPTSKAGLVGRRPAGGDEETAPTPPVGAFSNDALMHQDDTGRDVREEEPAMAGIPRDADQRMPRVASPGLPPVDPVERADLTEAATASSVVEDKNVLQQDGGTKRIFSIPDISMDGQLMLVPGLKFIGPIEEPSTAAASRKPKRTRSSSARKKQGILDDGEKSEPLTRPLAP